MMVPDRRLVRVPVASIVIVNYNGLRLLEPCLAATQKQADALGAEVILVDNASADGSVDFVRTRFPAAVLVQNDTNEGFAGGCNAGVRAARAPLVVLLNNDAVPEEGWLARLLEAVQPPDVAIACSVVNDSNYPAGYALGTGSVSVIGHPIPNVALDPSAPFYATGCSLAFKRELCGEPFEPVFFAYFEDTWLSWRARLLGYRVVRALGSVVQHRGSATASRTPLRSLYYYERNKLLMLLLCYELATLWRLLPLYLLDGLARAAQDCWLLLKAPDQLVTRGPGTLLRYLIVARSLSWLLTHPATIGRLRQRVQRERKMADSDITPLLSGKIFDDMEPTRGHSIANALSLLYCRWAGIKTAEQNGSRVRPGFPA